MTSGTTRRDPDLHASCTDNSTTKGGGDRLAFCLECLSVASTAGRDCASAWPLPSLVAFHTTSTSTTVRLLVRHVMSSRMSPGESCALVDTVSRILLTSLRSRKHFVRMPPSRDSIPSTTTHRWSQVCAQVCREPSQFRARAAVDKEHARSLLTRHPGLVGGVKMCHSNGRSQTGGRGMEGITRSCGLVTCTCRVLRYHTRENTLSLKGRIKHYTGDINTGRQTLM